MKKSGKFWQEKEIKDWSSREVQLFLEDSPWAKAERITVTIMKKAGPTGAQPPAVFGAIRTMRIETCCRTFEVPVAGGQGNSADSTERSGSFGSVGQSGTTYTFVARVLWFSSVSIRRAILRQRELQGTPMAASESALAPSSDFVLALSGSFLKLLEGLPPEEIKAITSLRAARGTRLRLSPSDYVPALPDASPMAFLIFPKTSEDSASISPEDGPVTLAMKGADFELKCTFPLDPMMIDGKVDW